MDTANNDSHTNLGKKSPPKNKKLLLKKFTRTASRIVYRGSSSSVMGPIKNISVVQIRIKQGMVFGNNSYTSLVNKKYDLLPMEGETIHELRIYVLDKISETFNIELTDNIKDGFDFYLGQKRIPKQLE